MIRISRIALPDELTDRLGSLTQEIAAVAPSERAGHARKLWRKTSTRANVHTPLSEVLREMAPGLEQCMYCGEDEGTGIDHFEPVNRSPLRTFDWLNHLLSCSMCNSHKKREQFPVDKNGKPLLIDPTAEDPLDHLFLALSLGQYAPLTDKGEATIAVCDLNRELLQRGRLHARRIVDVCLREWERASHRGDVAVMNGMVLAIRDQPFADVCQSMLRQAYIPGAEDIFDDSAELLRILRIPEVRQALVGQVGFDRGAR